VKPLDKPGGFAGTLPVPAPNPPFPPSSLSAPSLLASRWSALGWALLAVGCGVAALGCGDVRKVTQSIAREEPASLSLGADNRPGEGPAPQAPAPARTDKAQAPDAPADSAAQDDAAGDDEDAAEASSQSPRRAVSRSQSRRRRAASERGGAEPADQGGDEAAEMEDAASGLKVSRLVIARGVSGREPTGVARSFAASEVDRLHAFVELTNEGRAPSEIVVVFTPPGGGAPQRIKLDVGSERRWRTWATTRKARAAGTWGVAVTDASGAVLGRTSFTLTK